MIELGKPEGKKKSLSVLCFGAEKETSSMRILQDTGSTTADECLLQVCNLTRLSPRAQTSGITQKATLKSDTNELQPCK